MICANRSGNQVRQFIKSWKNLFEDAYLKEDLHFAECVLEDKTPCVTGNDGLMAVKIIGRKPFYRRKKNRKARRLTI